ncbi:MAG TPA: hypothetical protein VK762_18885 [Polyangiaceae bacterium]|nr:hypothetical protein [Polyangiaceae bacterium]
MTLRPILHDEPTDVERELLGSARLDAPSPVSRARALKTLGFLGDATATGADLAADPPTVASLAKWLVLAALAAAIALGAVAARRFSKTDDAERAAQQAGRLASAVGEDGAHRDAWMGVAPTDPAGSAAGSETTSLTVRPTARKTATGVAAPFDPGLAAEVASLDEIRRRLASGHAASSLRMLDAHERRFARPRLEPEAQLLRVETLVALGQVDAAADLGARLLADSPSSTYGQRVRSILAGRGGTGGMSR